jgi:2-polyprenyl-3-methyl-5-hydroxy-6-metoxy-1,4-benzoquinol methylase
MKYTQLNHRQFEIHSLVLQKVNEQEQVLELGCATGYFSKALKQKQCVVVGVEYEKMAAKQATSVCDQVIIANLESPLVISTDHKQFDTVLLMDVIEHIIHREQLLKNILPYLSSRGKLIVTTPNIAHIAVRWKLLFGDFTYTHQGIMDETHVHFFTRKTLVQLLLSCGFEIVEIDGSADFGLLPILGRFLRHIPKRLQYMITRLFPTFLHGQWLIVAKKK